MHMTISVTMVKSLSDVTGEKMMECKRALEESNGDYEMAKAKLLGNDDDQESEPEPADA